MAVRRVVHVYHGHHLLGSSARYDPLNSRSFSAYYDKDNEGHHAYWVYVADTSHGSSDEAGTRVDSDSFTNIRFGIGPR
jgi:hypothetical protein